MSRIILGALLFSWILGSCNQDTAVDYVPKPKGYNRLNLPGHSYRALGTRYPYTFEYSKYATILPDSFAPNEPNWIFVHYPGLNANIQITYKEVRNDPKRLTGFIDDSYKLGGKHHIRASAIQEQVIVSESKKTVAVFKLTGDVPSPYQFYTTDSVRHYLRGAIYLSTAVKNDSLAPVITYLQKDMMHLLNTLQWR